MSQLSCGLGRGGKTAAPVNHPKNDFLLYTFLAIILIIAACVTETLRRRRNLRLFLSFAALLFIVNAVVIWRNWYFH